MSNTYFKNYGTHTLSQSKRLIVNKNSKNTIHIRAEIGDVEQIISLPNMNNSYVFQKIGEDNWGENIAVELNIILYPIPPEKRITYNKLEYRMMVNINVFSTKIKNETPEDKQLVKDVFDELAENSEQIHIHPMDYYVMESDD